jgi:hypothetical protein
MSRGGKIPCRPMMESGRTRRDDMGTARWALLLSAVMFIASIWFILAGAKNARAAAAPATEPVATVRQLMDGLISPASTTVYKSVSIIISEAGVEENQPQSEDEWRAVEGAAAALVEAGGLLMAEGRARDQERWPEISKAMIDASMISMKAAQARDKDALLASGEALNASCDNCHRIYDVDE